MADEQTTDDVLNLTEEQQIGDETTEGSEASETEAQDEFAIELEGEEPIEETPLIRQLRAEVRDAKRELAERRKAEAPQIEVGPKPDLWEDADGDPDRYDALKEAWDERRRQAAQQKEEQEKATQVRNQEFERAVGTYRTRAAALPVKDFQQAEEAVRAALPDLLQSAIIQYADDPAKVVYALYKHPQKMAQIADEPDPIKAIKAVWNMERNIKVATRKAPPPPMAANIQRGSAPVASAPDKEAEKLFNAGQKSGDMTAYLAYQREQRRNANKAA